MKIESQDTDIETLLTGSFFHIPRFQRPYSWDAENISEFWEDLILNQDDDYFIGSMVVYKRAKQSYGVVDGQQRLTTITILLCVIRDEFLNLECSDYAKGLHQYIERKNRDNISSYVLKPETSFPYFQEKIQKLEEPDLDYEVRNEEVNLENAHKMFQKFVGGTLNAIDDDPSIVEENKKELKINKLINIRDIVLNLNVIFVVLDNEDDAYLIFETLNTRGKDLALSDLVKNHFSKHLKTKGDIDYAKIKWRKILETIHDSSAAISTNTFIYHFWASRYESVTLKKLFPKIRKAITQKRAKEYLNYLVSDSQLYRSIHETTYNWTKNENEVAKSLTALQLFKLQQPIPALLSLVRAYKDGLIKYKTLKNALRTIEKFHFVFTAVTSSRSSGGISAMYASFARRLFEAKDSQQASIEIKELTEKLRNKNPEFEEFKVAFSQIYYTNSKSKQKNLVRYILRKFSEFHTYKYPVDYEELTIEHLKPQAHASEPDWDEETIGKLGNLIFLDKDMNGKLKTKTFPRKLEILKQSGYSIPSYLENISEWTADSVNEHTNIMAEEAYFKIWHI